jgi:drug/metabolite transporter (DMT)-like permease
MTRDGNLRGATFMVASMAGFAAEDAFIKAAARHMPLGEVVTIVGLIGTLAFAAMTLRSGQPLWHPVMRSRPLVVRSGLEIAGRLFHALAITLTPISAASAILQASPLVVVAGAALIFGEEVGTRRWLAILAGFGGVILILRPGTDGFELLSLLAVAGTLGFAGRDLATRAAPRVLSNLQLGVAGFTMLTIAGAIILAASGAPVVPEARALALVAGAAVFAIAGYHALTVAMRTGEIGAVAPFRYTRLVFALVVGVMIFGERPDILTLAGAAIIVVSGLLALLPGRRA